MAKPRRTSVRQEFKAIRRSLSAVARAIQRLAEAAAAATGSSTARRGRKLKLSPKRRAALKLQGQYMGHLRNLVPKHKSKVKAARTTQGIRSAIALARRLAKA
ncbi:MAG TPA: hypothetical protein VFM88_04405 [Vicinamibacteria bacterium]|nr:hypothetical protein [Vicinamibacteria bacterium]